MNNNLLVSIIIPVYNGEKWLAGAVRSALNQTYSNIEIIIINDGSSDKSLELCKSFSYDSRVSIIDKDNGGQASARNRGLVEAKGDFILFLDCDDTLQPNAVEVCLNAVNESTDFVLFGFNVYNNGCLLRTPHTERISYCNNNYDDFKKFEWLLDSACNKLYKRSYIQFNFLLGSVYGEDGIFNFDNFQNNTNVECISNCLYNVNLDNPNSINKKYRRGRLRDSLLSCQKKISMIDNSFDKIHCDVDFIPKCLSVFAFSVRLAASNLSFNHFQEEIASVDNLYSFLNNSITRIGGFHSMKFHNKVILYLLFNKKNKLVYSFSRLINRIA